MKQTTEFEVDNIPTSHHILIVSNTGELIQQVKVRETRDYSISMMLRAGLENLIRMIKNKQISL